MRTWLWLLKARTLLLCSALVVLIGLAPVLYLAGLVAWQVDMYLQTRSWIALPAALVFIDRALLLGGDVAPLLAFIPHVDWAWRPNELTAQILRALHIGLIPGLVGCGIVAVGISGVLRQTVLIRIHKRRKKDPVQPPDSYPREATLADPGRDGRSEPFIGTPDFAPPAANDTPAAPRAAQTAPPERHPPACPRGRGRPMKRRAVA